MAKFKRFLLYYLSLWGLLFHLSLIGAFLFALDYYVLTPRQFFIKVAEKSGLGSTPLLSLLEPSPRHAEHEFDGRLKTTHPRIILPQLSQWDGLSQPQLMAQRLAAYEHKGIQAPPPPCSSDGLMALTACWVITGSQEHAARAINILTRLDAETPDPTGQYGNGWMLALAYDLLTKAPAMTASQRQAIEARLEAALLDYLRVLDGNSASLWHGRTTLAANAWLCAVVLTPEGARRQDLIRRAQGHFLGSMQALSTTESWPGGYNYWINNRAFYISLAAAAYLNGLEDARFGEDVRTIMERVGLWHIHATRPDHRIEGFGDEGPRIDLKDETRRAIDIMAGITQHPALSLYSYFLQQRHGIESYYRGYRWSFHLFNDPELLPASASGDLSDMAAWLPPQALFGRHASNQLYLRSSWHSDATFISYRASHHFTHHGHYDAGHFTLFKGVPLAVNSSTYGDFNAANRLYYSMRTIAKNSLLIQRPRERVKPNRFFTQNVADGGQRITLPTGSAITSVQHWRDNLYRGQHLEGAELEAYEAQADFLYIGSNLTPAYNNSDFDDNGGKGKVELVQRELFYLRRLDRLLVRDRVLTTDQAYRTKWLMHSKTKPALAATSILRGEIDNGILESQADRAVISEGLAHLQLQVLVPQQATTRLVGGPDYRYYVETDGDDSTLDGENFSAGASIRNWFDEAHWRLEIFPREQRRDTDFLMVLTPTLTDSNQPNRRDESANLLPMQTTDEAQRNHAIRLDDTLVIFATSGAQLELEQPAGVRYLYLVAPENVRPRLRHGEVVVELERSGRVFHSRLAEGATSERLQLAL